MLDVQKLTGATLALGLAFGTTGIAHAAVTPAVVDEVLAPGESITIDKFVDTPEISEKVDFLLLLDLSGSYGDDLANIKALDDGIFDDIRAEVADSRFAVASFIDYPTSPWGSFGDYEFNLDQNFTTDKTTWTGAIDALTLGSGNDFPESQYAGLLGSANDASWRPDATRVIAITTDASFHLPTDSGGTYPGPSRDDVVNALNADNIKVIAIKAPGSGAEMDDVAAATGGSVVTTGASSAEIADAILTGLSDLDITVTPNPVGCDPLDVSFAPASQTVPSGTTVEFEETIAVPNNPALAGSDISCTVVFEDENGNSLGEQRIRVVVPDDAELTAACTPTTNPHGKNVPKAGEKSKGQNEDGFYLLEGTSSVDEDPAIYVNGFGPFMSGDKVKITEAPGAEPKMQTMGSDKGKAGDIAAHLILDTDATVTVVDEFGNEIATMCLVPPMPK